MDSHSVLWDRNDTNEGELSVKHLPPTCASPWNEEDEEEEEESVLLEFSGLILDIDFSHLVFHRHCLLVHVLHLALSENRLEVDLYLYSKISKIVKFNHIRNRDTTNQ